MNHCFNNYEDGLRFVLENGEKKLDRTKIGTLSVFSVTLNFDLRTYFPAITTKKLAWKSVLSELLWFLEGSNDERRLCEILHGTRDGSKKTIWTENANAPYWIDKAKFEGDVGRIYGVQWRRWQNSNGQTFDQIKDIIHKLKHNPNDRRIILSAWNPGELDQMALPPCHNFCQFYVQNGELSCQLYQRSADFFLGVPFDIASYATLTHMLAQVSGLKVGDLITIFGDSHIYLNHIEQVKEQLSRNAFTMPTIELNPKILEIDQFTMNDINLIDYQSHPAIKAPMAV